MPSPPRTIATAASTIFPLPFADGSTPSFLPLAETLEEETEIVRRRSEALGRALELPAEPPTLDDITRLVTIFRELREGQTLDKRTKLKIPTGTLSTAEAISVLNNGLAMAAYFGDGTIRAGDLASGLTGTIVKDPAQDGLAWKEYLETVVKEREGWRDLYRACRERL